MAENSDRPPYKPADYLSTERLFIGYRKADINEGTEKIELNFFRFPDFSCNWERFSTSKDVRLREKGLPTDGSISLLVKSAQYQKMATPCHDPLTENYSHTEIRQLTVDEPLTYEPPKGRKLESHNWSSTKRREYRQNLVNSYIVEDQAMA
ncbi:MAG: hypothetical protein PHC61_00580 [Chitinivibrionales bacterium]|nr:hypothetical protein [Chitinivibrionales bacterium]